LFGEGFVRFVGGNLLARMNFQFTGEAFNELFQVVDWGYLLCNEGFGKGTPSFSFGIIIEIKSTPTSQLK
jgi:hypothetical protein